MRAVSPKILLISIHKIRLKCNLWLCLCNCCVVCDIGDTFHSAIIRPNYLWVKVWCHFNTLRPRQDSHHFAEDIFKYIFFNENVFISIKISLKDPINNIPALVQIMAWYQQGDKPLPEPMMIILLTHICASLPQWVEAEWWIYASVN